MANSKRYIAAGSFLLSAVSIVFVLVSAVSDSWVKAEVRTQGSMNKPALIHYGLYRGEVEFIEGLTSVIHDLHMVCVPSTKACAITCKTTADARYQEVIYLAIGYRPATLACDDNTNYNHQQQQMGHKPVLSMALYFTVNFFLYLQLLYAVCSALLALMNTFEDPSHPLLGLQGVAMTSCASALKGMAVLLIWGVHCSSGVFKNHLAFAYVAAQTAIVSASSGYSYWVLLFAVMCSLSSMALALLRMYLNSRGKL